MISDERNNIIQENKSVRKKKVKSGKKEWEDYRKKKISEYTVCGGGEEGVESVVRAKDSKFK